MERNGLSAEGRTTPRRFILPSSAHPAAEHDATRRTLDERQFLATGACSAAQRRSDDAGRDAAEGRVAGVGAGIGGSARVHHTG